MAFPDLHMTCVNHTPFVIPPKRGQYHDALDSGVITGFPGRNDQRRLCSHSRISSECSPSVGGGSSYRGRAALNPIG